MEAIVQILLITALLSSVVNILEKDEETACMTILRAVTCSVRQNSFRSCSMKVYDEIS